MVLSNEQRMENFKKSTKKWRDNNRDHYNNYMKNAMREWTAANREHYNKTKRDYHRWRKISKTFREILIDY